MTRQPLRLAIPSDRSMRNLSIDVVQNPDVARRLLQRQHKAVFRERDLYHRGYTPGDHQGWAVKRSHAKGLAQWRPSRWIEPDTPHVVKARMV